MADEYNAPVYIEDLGDGLFRVGYDIFCTYPLKSHVIAETSVTYNYEPYSVIVSWTWNADTATKTDIKWERVYN